MYEFFDIINNKSGASEVTRYFRLNEGTTDGYEVNVRLIPNPKVHFDVEFKLLGAVGLGTLVAQNVSGTVANREFHLQTLGASFAVVIGGGVTNFTEVATSGIWRLKFSGADVDLIKNGAIVETVTPTVGAATEASATTTMCMRHNGSQSSHDFYYPGVMSDVVIRNSSGTPVNGYFINDNGNTLVDNVGSADAAILNPNADDWGFFTEQPTLWKGQSLVVPPWDSVDQELSK